MVNDNNENVSEAKILLKKKDKEENIVLKTVNKNIDLSEIKNNYNTDNNSSDLKKLQSMEINFLQI